MNEKPSFKELGITEINLDFNEFILKEKDILNLIPTSVIQKYNIFVFEKQIKNNEIILNAITDEPIAFYKEKEILADINNANKDIVIDKIVFFGTSEKEGLKKIINVYYGIDKTIMDISHNSEEPFAIESDNESFSEEELDKEKQEASQETMISKVNNIIYDAINKKASDIHFETIEKGMDIRFRIDGMLIKQNFNISLAERNTIINRLLVSAELKMEVKKEPQDGSFSFKKGKTKIDVRISYLPTLYGGKVVLRLLDKRNTTQQLEPLGFSEQAIKIIKRNINKPNGVILLTGPTGSGKTTTLYAFLSMIDEMETKNIQTLENPIEYQIDGINQTQVTDINKLTSTLSTSLDFAAGLRAILRQDPNVIMLGEIRDPETCNLVINASRTGHLVFSTIHTNEALGSISRLKGLGADEEAIAEVLDLVISQRLVRKVCKKCAVKYTLVEEDFETLSVTDKEILEKNKEFLLKGKGCAECSNTGYSGRTTIYEIFELNDEIRGLIESKTNLYDIKKHIRTKYKKTNIWEHGLELVINGVTTLSELKNVINPSSSEVLHEILMGKRKEN